jgi:hypothetical protein
VPGKIGRLPVPGGKLEQPLDVPETNEPPPGRRLQRRMRHPATDGQRFGEKLPDCNPHFVSRQRDDPRRGILRRGVEKLRILPRNYGRPRERLDDAGREAALEHRDQLVPDPVAHDRNVEVARVLSVGDAPIRKILEQFATRLLDERPDDESHPGKDAGQPPRARTPQEPQQERFCLVVPRVPDRDPAGTEKGRSAVEELVAHRTRRFFQGTSVGNGPRTNVDRLHLDRQAESPREIAAKRLVLLGRARSQAMVQVGQAGDEEVARGFEFPQDVYHRHRVGSPRKRRNEGRSARKQMEAPDGAPDALRKR